MIEVKLRAHAGQFHLAAEVSGSGVTCIAGRNGAGKTTLLRAIAGFLRIDEGQVLVGGLDVSWLPAERRGIVLVTPGSALLHLEVDSHLVWGLKLLGKQIQEDEVSKVKSELGIDFGGRVGRLSMGMRERVSLATALLSEPKVILVDEAFASLHDREDFIAAYGRLLARAHIDLIFSSQLAADGKLADNLYMIEEGVTTAGNDHRTGQTPAVRFQR